jgi:sulfatase maturation enzyme AslB (radical SAM superfamily)
LTYLEKIYTVCKQKNIYFSVSISLDGYGEIHDKIRGIPNVFGKTIATIREINKNRKKYCDSFDVGCTITQQNANHLVELDVFAKKENIDIKYRIGIENKRIESYPISKQFSIFHQKTEFSVREYIFSMYMRTKNLNDRFKYFSIFQSICNKRTKRLAGCVWKDRAITIDARGEVFYCAVESNSIGSLREKKGEEIFFDKKNLLYRKAIVDQKCMSCVHDYIGPIEFKDAMSFLKELVFNRYYLYVYYVKGLFT